MWDPRDYSDTDREEVARQTNWYDLHPERDALMPPKILILVVMAIIALPLFSANSRPELVPVSLLGLAIGLTLLIFILKYQQIKAQTPLPVVPVSAPQVPAIQIEDMGMVAYWGDTSAYVFHTQAIPNTVEALQPYIQLRVIQAAAYRVRCEIRDAQAVLVFSHEVEPFLMQATNLILPPARLPLHDMMREGEWTLTVVVNDTVQAEHRFHWRADQIDGVTGQVEADGEVDEAVLPLLADNYAKPLSVDDLLANDDDQQRDKG